MTRYQDDFGEVQAAFYERWLVPFITLYVGPQGFLVQTLVWRLRLWAQLCHLSLPLEACFLTSHSNDSPSLTQSL